MAADRVRSEGSYAASENAPAAWDAAVTNWRSTREHAFLRAYSDDVNRMLVARWLPDLRGAKVLKTDVFDEAVGEGLYPSLAAAGANLEFVDVSRAALAAAWRRYPELDAAQADVRRLRHEDRRFDVVVSNSTLDHLASLTDVADALDELQRVLKPGGRLLITLDNPLNPLLVLRRALPARLLIRIGLTHYFLGATCGPVRLEEMLRKAGFSVDRRGAVMHFPRALARALAAVFGNRAGMLRFVVAFERLDRSPLRYLSGQFVAALAVKR